MFSDCSHLRNEVATMAAAVAMSYGMTSFHRTGYQRTFSPPRLKKFMYMAVTWHTADRIPLMEAKNCILAHCDFPLVVTCEACQPLFSLCALWWNSVDEVLWNGKVTKKVNERMELDVHIDGVMYNIYPPNRQGGPLEHLFEVVRSPLCNIY